MNPLFIAEVKTQSMFGFKSSIPRHKLLDAAIEHGDWISIHTDPRFGGSFDDIYTTRKLTNKPILAKGFHCHDDDVKKALDLGADHVLVVDRYSTQPNVIFEFSNIYKKIKATLSSYDMEVTGYFVTKYMNKPVVYNGRDLRTGDKRKTDLYKKYRLISNWICGASLIKTKEDVQKLYPNCDAFIVGEHLMEFIKS